tara:strand:+ start:575 stop:1297 length:723 start_codon:yes stop_codon:yes gene_type:complete
MILITRHKEENTFIQKTLLTRGVQSIGEPITRIRHLSKKLIAENQKVFLVGSVQALNTIKLKKNLNNLSQSVFYAIGKKSASAIRDLKLNIKLIGIDSRDLIFKIKKNKNHKKFFIEYLCSNILNHELISDLRKIKAKVKKNVIYEILPNKLFTKKTLNLLKNDKIKVIMLFSKYNCELFLKICRNHGITKKNLSKIHFITMSKRNSKALIKKNLDVSWPSKPELEPMIRLAIKKQALSK